MSFWSRSSAEDGDIGLCVPCLGVVVPADELLFRQDLLNDTQTIDASSNQLHRATHPCFRGGARSGEVGQDTVAGLADQLAVFVARRRRRQERVENSCPRAPHPARLDAY